MLLIIFDCRKSWQDLLDRIIDHSAGFRYVSINRLRTWLAQGLFNIKLVVSGDFYQLPPVPDRFDGGKLPVTFAFDAKSWNRCIDVSIILGKVFRQKEQSALMCLCMPSEISSPLLSWLKYSSKYWIVYDVVFRILKAQYCLNLLADHSPSMMGSSQRSC